MTYGDGRKLERIREDLAQVKEQGKIKGFLHNVGNAKRLSGLLEDIRDAMMEYQVCILLGCLSVECLMIESDLVAARYLRQELPAHSECRPLVLDLCE